MHFRTTKSRVWRPVRRLLADVILGTGAACGSKMFHESVLLVSRAAALRIQMHWLIPLLQHRLRSFP